MRMSVTWGHEHLDFADNPHPQLILPILADSLDGRPIGSDQVVLGDDVRS